MVNFSTEFPLSSDASINDVLSLACKWLAGSPHSSFGESSFETLPENEKKTLREQNETVVLATAHPRDHAIGGIQYRRVEKGLAWTTSVVTRKEKRESLFSVQVSCESVGTLINLPSPKKPYIIKQVLRDIGGGQDGEIPVADKPFVLDESQAYVAAALIKGEAENKLPIVYISVGFDGTLPVDPAKIAPYLAGLAHVVVEPSRNFSTELRYLVKGRNVYGGAIGIYWPQSNARRSYFLDRYDGDSRALQRDVSDQVIKALSNRRLTTGCTWLHLQEELSRVRVDELREKGSSSIDEYVEAFDAELDAKNQRIREANNEIYKLRAELLQYTSDTVAQSDGLLRVGGEQNLYPNELHDLVIGTLEESLKNLREDSRREHVISDLVEANPRKSEAEKMQQTVKEVFNSGKKLRAKERSTLEGLGFSLSEDGKHFKLVFRADKRYTFAVSKTSSDHRAGKNAASDICNTIF